MEDPQNRTKTSKGSIISNILYLLAGTAISQGFSAITLLITARQLGPEYYGQYTSALTLTTTASILFSLGLNTWGIHEASRQKEESSQILGSIFTIKLFLGAFWCFIIWVISFIFHWIDIPVEIILLSALIVWTDNLLSTLLTRLIASLRNHLTSIIVISSELLLLSATLTIIYTGDPGTINFLLTRLLILLFTVLVVAPLIIYYFHLTSRLKQIVYALTHVIPYAVTEFLNNSIRRTDVLLVAIFLGTTAAGFYAPAVSIINIALLFFDSTGGVLLPVLSRQFSENLQLGWKLSRRYVLLQALAGILLFMLLEIIQKPLSYYLGDQYSNSFYLLRLMSIIVVFHSFGSSTGVILTSVNQQAKRARIQVIGVTLNIILNIIFLPWFDLVGAAVAYIIAEFYMAIGCSFAVLKYRLRSPLS